MATDLAVFRKQIAQKRIEVLERISKVPVAALVWGPTPTSADPVAQARLSLRDALRSNGHLAEFSEDLYDSSLPQSNLVQQVAQAEVFDIVFSIPASFGSIGEIHDFARIPGLSHKVIAFIDQMHLGSYSSQSLLATQTSASCKVEVYDASKLPDSILKPALDQVRRLQELLYVSGRR